MVCDGIYYDSLQTELTELAAVAALTLALECQIGVISYK